MNTDIDLVDFMDLINYTLHKDFVDKWRYKYSEKFIKHFQIKILESLNKQKILKLTSLFNYLTKKCRYSPEQVENFFESIDISIYSPLIIHDKIRPKWSRRIYRLRYTSGCVWSLRCVPKCPILPGGSFRTSYGERGSSSWCVWHPLRLGFFLHTAVQN